MPENNTAADTTQTTIPFPRADQEQLDISTLETWLWNSAREVSFHAHPGKRISRTGLSRSDSRELSNLCHVLIVPFWIRFRDSISSI